MKAKNRSYRRFYPPQLIFAAATFFFLCGFIMFFLDRGDTAHDGGGDISTGCSNMQQVSEHALIAVDRAIEAVRASDYGLTEKHLKDAHRRLMLLVKNKEQIIQVADRRGERDE